MPNYPKPNTVLNDIRGIKSQVHHHGTRAKSNPDDTPAAPTVTLDFQVREKQSRIDYDAIATSSAVTPNTCAADIGQYVFQMRARKANGDPIPQAQLSNGDDVIWTRIINRKDTADMNTPHANFERVPNPKEWYFQARARVIDRIGHLGTWSAWTAVVKPTLAADPVPPTPTALAMNFDRVEKDRHNRYRCIATCNEITAWDIPGGDDEGDIDRYEFELRKSDVAGTPDTEAGRRRTVHQGADNNNLAKVIFFPVRKNLYYVLRVRAIDRFNRHGAWSNWTGAGSVSDTTAPPVPTTVILEGLFNHVAIDWAAPLDANGDPNEDVAYFQAQRATDRAFSNIVGRDMYIVGTRRSWDTNAYKQRFFLRVRSVDESGNKSVWVEGGPISPQKATASRTTVVGTPSPANVAWINDAGIELVGGITNRAYTTSGTGNVIATAEGEGAFGDVLTNIQLSPTINRSNIGVVFHYIDASNFMYVRIIHTVASGSKTEFHKVVSGTDTLIVSSSLITYTDGQAYKLKVSISSTLVRVYIDDTSILSFTLSAGDQTTFNSATKVGLYKRLGTTTDDDGGSRHEDFAYTLNTGEIVIDDPFDRVPSTTLLGVADSGQTWTTVSGVWGIVNESLPTALYGYGTTLPILYMEDVVERSGGFNVAGTTSGGTTLMGQNGYNSGPLIIEIDRPTRIVMMAWANVMNQSDVNDFNTRMFAVVEDWNGVQNYGRQTTTFTPAGDATNGRRRLLSTVHQAFLDPSGTALAVKFWFGYRQSLSADKAVTIANQKMIILLSYAPDFDPLTPNQRLGWSKSGLMTSAYRGVEQSD